MNPKSHLNAVKSKVAHMHVGSASPKLQAASLYCQLFVALVIRWCNVTNIPLFSIFLNHTKEFSTSFTKWVLTYSKMCCINLYHHCISILFQFCQINGLLRSYWLFPNLCAAVVARTHKYNWIVQCNLYPTWAFHLAKQNYPHARKKKEKKPSRLQHFDIRLVALNKSFQW